MNTCLKIDYEESDTSTNLTEYEVEECEIKSKLFNKIDQIRTKNPRLTSYTIVI